MTAAAEIKSANDWMSMLQASTNAIWSKLPPSSSNSRSTALFGRPVRIAVIDTGAAIEGSLLKDLYSNRLIECRSWVGEGPSRLIRGLRKRDPRQESPPENDLRTTTKAIALAIEYATQHWQVEIISLSFGTKQAVENLGIVLDKHAPNVLFFAVASNCGGNEPNISWPARHGSVISIHASDGHGNSYRQNPNPRKNHYNLSMLGTAVSGLWPQSLQSNSRYKIKSGTSCATPIAAGAAANILTLMRRQAALHLSKVSGGQCEQAVLATERLMRKLRQPPVMRKIMFEIGVESCQRQGYDYVSPWHIFRGSPEMASNRIKKVVDAL